MNKKVTRGIAAAALAAACLVPMNAAFAAEYSYTLPDGVSVSFNADTQDAALAQFKDYVAAVNTAQGTHYVVNADGSVSTSVQYTLTSVDTNGVERTTTSPVFTSETAANNYVNGLKTRYSEANGFKLTQEGTAFRAVAIVQTSGEAETQPAKPELDPAELGKVIEFTIIRDTPARKDVVNSKPGQTVDQKVAELKAAYGKNYNIFHNGNTIYVQNIPQAHKDGKVEVTNPNGSVFVDVDGNIDEYVAKLASKYGKDYFVIRFGNKINVVPTNGMSPATKWEQLSDAYGKNYKVTHEGNIFTVTRIEQTSGDAATAEEKPALDPAKLNEAKPAATPAKEAAKQATKLAQTGADVTVMSALAAFVAVAAGAALSLKRKLAK